jgi:hypothetical protein
MNDFANFIRELALVLLFLIFVGLPLLSICDWIFSQFDSYALCFYCDDCKENHAGHKWRGNICPKRAK